jgi:hypothetical protein
MNRDEGERKDVGSLTGEEVAKHNSKDSCWVIGTCFWWRIMGAEYL